MRGCTRVLRCVHATAPALSACALPRLRALAGRRNRACVQLRVARVQCDLCKVCAHEQSWQQIVDPGGSLAARRPFAVHG